MGRNSVRVTSTLSSRWLPKNTASMDLAVLQMVTDIHRAAGILAPVDSGSLVKSGRISREGNAHYAVTYGGGQVPYAKRRHFENNKNPQTKKYLSRAGDSIAKRGIKPYLRSYL